MQSRELLTLAFLLTGSSAAWAGVAEECRQDLDSLPAYLLANDAGGRDAWNRYGEAHFSHAIDEARTAVAAVADESACTQALRTYLKAWRDGHLSVRDDTPQAASATARDEKPRIEWLSTRTVSITVPSFASAWQAPLEQLLRENRRELARHPNWIVDVRGNSGGSDSVYGDVLRWIGSAELTQVQVEYLATADNIAAASRACAIFAPGDASCEQAMKGEQERMQSVPSGSWVLQQKGAEVMSDRQELERVRPSRVAILVDSGCGSTCEQFLLDARQSFSVKLVGQHSRGSLDYSNLRPHALPSGHRTLMYAVTRTKRIPAMPVDGVGVMPDVYVPAAEGADLVKKVQRWLEGA
jgi:diadenosine tetraphosphatase ApaH/serine/threonine PP2A family protein phosphatase